jgi:acetyl esterase
VRIHRPAPGPLPVVVYFHGGGWVIGDLDTHEGLCRELAVEARAIVVAVDYRLAPEHPFPAAADDACAVLAAVLEGPEELGTDPSRVVVAGDSAGGNLAAVAAQWAVAHGHALAGQVLAYPVADTRTDTASYESFATGHGLTREVMGWFLDAYLPDGTDRDDPGAAPLRSPDLAGVAPALVITCELDVLHDEGLAYAEALRSAGVAVEQVEVPGMVHGALLMPAVTPAAVEMRQRIVDFLGSVWS